MRFDDDSYIEAFYQRGEYPKIHNDIFHISHNLRDEIVLDLDGRPLPRVKEILILHGVQTVYARRVFPELYDTGGLALVKKVCALFAEVGIQHIVIEGRQKTPNATNL